MKTYQEMTLAERQAEYAALCRTHQEQKALGLDLNMARATMMPSATDRMSARLLTPSWFSILAMIRILE